MSVLIGHASIDENGRAKGGVAGDQTGKELCIRTWYNKPWDYVLRCKDLYKADAMATACEKACKNDHIGYDQNQRNTLRTQAALAGYDLSRISVDCECDCSSLMAVCAECAGIKIPYNGNNAPTTTTMKQAFLSTGYFGVISNSDYTHKDNLLKRGDILVKAGSHTVMVLGDGSESDKLQTPTLKIGTKNEYVKHVQLYLSLLGYEVGAIDSVYGPQTANCVKEYQMEKGLLADGIWGKQCWNSVGKFQS